MKNKAKIPTILGLIVLILGVAVGVVLVQNNQVFRLGASLEEIPKEVKVTNITDTSFTVSWITQKPGPGFVSWGENESLGRTSQDDRDQAVQTNSSTHFVSIRGLKPKTKYFFKVASGGNSYDNNGIPYEVLTGPTLSTDKIDLISGSVTTSTGAPADGVIVYLTLGAASPVSALTNSSGNWFVSLSTVRTLDLSGFASYQPDASILELFFQAGANGSTSAQIRPASAKPVPLVSLGNPPYDFRNLALAADVQAPPTSSLGTIPESSPASGFDVGELVSPGASKTTIVNPEDNEEINSTLPQFRGTGDPGQIIEIEVFSQTPVKGSVTVGSRGNWAWTPAENLEPGEHSITISFRDASGTLRKITRSFTVLAAGESDLPAFTSTPSGSLTPSASPTPTQKTSPPPTGGPTSSASARVSLPSTESAVPESGTLTPTFALFIMGIGLIFVGVHFFLKARRI